ncbi:MAG: thrombospondin type 3 repeat-containing protein [Candidatus Zixiibacteriota bacterium]
MNKKLLILLACVLALCSTGIADWVPEDGHKMHFPQLPNEIGWDVNATEPIVLADDWMCSETGWVKDIHFWGSWLNGIEGQVLYFVLSIHADIPADPPAVPYSRPGPTLWEREISNFIILPLAPGTMEGWYDPAAGTWLANNHEEFFQYNVFLDENDWFWQEEGTIYWLNISAVVADPAATKWGWKSSLNHWNDDAVWAYWGALEWIDMWEPPDFITSLDLSFVITGGKGADTCEYYKPQYLDYAPQGMPDFDQKQGGWSDPAGWTHCGPAAVANCLWWFDSKFETSPRDPRPFGVAGSNNDSYPLVADYSGLGYDDHDPANVQPLINNLAALMNTNVTFRGTLVANLQVGTRNFIANAGLTGQFKDTIVAWPTFDYIKQQVLDCQDVILLLIFCEYDPIGQTYSALGGHYVTVAGVCTTQTQICISDPFYDALEGEPPAGSAHGGAIHNDADNISGPHSQINHDPYLTSVINPGLPWPGPLTVLNNYPISGSDINNFIGSNVGVDVGPYNGGQIFTIINIAYVICPDTAPVIDSCDYYKAPYGDYAPNGVPDFDQKQNAWTDPASGAWSHCGPVALANCFWWFDSKFEPSPVDPRPFWPGPGSPGLNDGYPLVSTYDPTGWWDDHDTNNVVPFVDSLAKYCLTNTGGNSGTNVFDLANGAQDWLDSVGLGNKYLINVYPVDNAPASFEFLRGEVLRSQDVILLLGFWQEVSPGYCERVGGHYVTVGGTCTSPADSAFCISDPFLDMHEGEPPAGSAHVSSVHNDASNISGPHGTIYHDKYFVVPNTCPPMMPPIFATELANYPSGPAVTPAFTGQNNIPGVGTIVYQPMLTTHVVVEYAIVICSDRDGDGWSDDQDNCPDVYNPDQIDTDGDGNGDACDSDDDNDGVLDGSDNSPLNPDLCEDLDGDQCDDCAVGTDDYGPLPDNNPSNDGTDTDGDGLCDVGDPDDDNDGVTDAADTAPLNPDICQDSDGDGCDDCAVGTDDFGPLPDNLPNNDGTDTDADGMCDVGDPDDDNDGVADAADTAPLNPDICEDTDGDACDDCAIGTDNFGPLADNNPNNDGTDTDADGLCDAGDPDDDNDGVLDGADTDPLNPDVCEDVDSDGCDDCAVGTDDFGPMADNLPNNDGTDTDSDGICDLTDNCINDYNPLQEDTDGDGIGDSCETTTCDCLPGEANGNSAYNILDVTYLISYLYKGGAAPTPYALCSGDANCNCAVNILDVTYLISYLYKGGAAPCDCPTWLSTCGPPLRK